MVKTSRNWSWPRNIFLSISLSKRDVSYVSGPSATIQKEWLLELKNKHNNCSISPKMAKSHKNFNIVFHLLTRVDAKGATIIYKIYFNYTILIIGLKKLKYLYSFNDHSYLYARSIGHYPVLKDNIHRLAFHNAVYLLAIFSNINSISYLMNIWHFWFFKVMPIYQEFVLPIDLFHVSVNYYPSVALFRHFINLWKNQ